MELTSVEEEVLTAIADALADSGKPQDHMLTPRKRWRGFRKLKSIEMAIAAS